MAPDLKMSVMPTKLRYKLVVSFCLMSILPMLAGIYIISLFVKFPFDMSHNNLVMISLVTLFSISVSFFGYLITKQIFSPIAGLTAAAHDIAEGKLDESSLADTNGSDELEGLTKSLRVISNNARELLSKVEKLSMKDTLTGLYNATYIRERLNEEIERAIHYQRPCSFAYLNMDGFNNYVAKYGFEYSDEALRSAAKILETHLLEFDRAARISKDEFAIIFPDKNKKKTIQIIEGISKDIAAFSFGIKNDSGFSHLTLCAGISENPIDGVSADELYVKAQERMRAAKQKGPNLIEAFI
ncbi:MAG: hypothetical protein AUJ72_03550 [Candidatus Omnitrophica bacterium CG1_02_46_14]|nr:MAG: hypothetical protein AUJ72_03550 [Candidatus Omnitrophica bacterium CG1_02_46_14]